MIRAWPLLLVLAGTPAFAAEPAAVPDLARDHAHIDASAGAASQGRIAINQAAGTGNAQSNLAALALSATGGVGLAGVGSRQSTPATGDRGRDLAAVIGAGAFGATQGLVSVNQAAGSGNAQSNLFALAQGTGLPTDGGVGLDDSVLAAVAGAPLSPITASDASAPRYVEIADTAFAGGQGVVQVNQTAGVGNQSTNAIVLQLPGGAPP